MNNAVPIGKASKITGLPAKTIRYYEEIKLLNPAQRLENDYRVYSKEDLDVLILIKEAKSLGLPLKDIREVVHLCISQGCAVANDFLKTKVPSYLEDIEVKMKELQDLQDKLLSLKQNLINKGDNCLICKNC